MSIGCILLLCFLLHKGSGGLRPPRPFIRFELRNVLCSEECRSHTKVGGPEQYRRGKCGLAYLERWARVGSGTGRRCMMSVPASPFTHLRWSGAFCEPREMLTLR